MFVEASAYRAHQYSEFPICPGRHYGGCVSCKRGPQANEGLKDHEVATERTAAATPSRYQ